MSSSLGEKCYQIQREINQPRMLLFLLLLIQCVVQVSTSSGKEMLPDLKGNKSTKDGIFPPGCPPRCAAELVGSSLRIYKQLSMMRIRKQSLNSSRMEGVNIASLGAVSPPMQSSTSSTTANESFEMKNIVNVIFRLPSTKGTVRRYDRVQTLYRS